ncbi:MAG: polysaccharide biosynthesis C-terminal domain-containing protein, partial [candidate division KSB1 bacterium]|nr:polysaccharide biosynthesis C-terminal domain-containing protein [candidate division KSB1 bacterium]
MANNGMKGCTAIVLLLIPLDLLFNAYLVPQMGANGAAVATSLTMAVGLIASSIYMIKQYNVYVGFTSIVRALAASTALLLLSTWIQPSSHWELFAKLFLLAIVYFVLLRMTGEISGEDMQNLKTAVVSKLFRPSPLIPEGANKR